MSNIRSFNKLYMCWLILLFCVEIKVAMFTTLIEQSKYKDLQVIPLLIFVACILPIMSITLIY